MHPKRLIGLGLIALFALAAVPAFAQDEGEDKALALFIARPQILVRTLHLTQAQITSLNTLVTATRTAIRPLRADIQSLNQQIHAALNGGNPDACAVGALVVSRHEKYEAIEALLQQFDDDFSATLTPAQLATYEVLKDRARHPR